MNTDCGIGRRTFLKQMSLAAGVAAAPGCFQAMAAEKKRPNIIFIMADDLGYGHLGCYGQEKIRTPHLDRMAREGLRFTDAYAGCPQCAPSRSVLMTGLHAGHTPVRGNSGGIPLRDEDVTVAEILQDAGYRTGLFGKWGLGDADTAGVPNRQGFDEFFGYLHQKHAHFYYTDYLWHNEEKYPLDGNRDGKRTQYSHDVILEKCLDFIGEDHENPFFCFLSLTIPHHEWTVPEESLAEYRGQFDEERPRFRWREGYAFPEAPKANMAGMITHMDKGAGRIIELLEKKGIAEDTLVIFTSDNGPDRYSLACADFFNARGGLRGYKYDMYEGGLRMPAIAWQPGTVPAGATDDTPWFFADLLPTFAALAGADGVSIAPVLLGAGAGPDEDRLLYWEAGTARAARCGKWKVVKADGGGDYELYDLAEDIAEENNLAERHPDILDSIKDRMRDQHEAAPPQIEPGAPDGRYYR
jgi:arylsulfatase A